MELEMNKPQIWNFIVILASIITQIESSELNGEQKKDFVIQKIKALLRPLNLPIPEFVLGPIISPLIDYLVDRLNESGLFAHG